MILHTEFGDKLKIEGYGPDLMLSVSRRDPMPMRCVWLNDAELRRLHAMTGEAIASQSDELASRINQLGATA